MKNRGPKVVNSRFPVLGTVRRLGLMPLVNGLANRWFALIKRACRLLGVSELDVIYTDRFFRAETRMTAPSAAVVVECLRQEFSPTSVADVGCGTGVYLREFEKCGTRITGYEGSRCAIRSALVDESKLQLHDLREPISEGELYDLVLCFEVGEHLAERWASQLVANIVTLGDMVAFSAAPPGQGGTDHVNEQPPEYWIRLFERVGYHQETERTARLRRMLHRQEMAWWLGDNLLVLERKAKRPMPGSQAE